MLRVIGAAGRASIVRIPPGVHRQQCDDQAGPCGPGLHPVSSLYTSAGSACLSASGIHALACNLHRLLPHAACIGKTLVPSALQEHQATGDGRIQGGPVPEDGGALDGGRHLCPAAAALQPQPGVAPVPLKCPSSHGCILLSRMQLVPASCVRHECWQSHCRCCQQRRRGASASWRHGRTPLCPTSSLRA